MKQKVIVISNIPTLTSKQEVGMLKLLTGLQGIGLKTYLYSQYHHYPSLKPFEIEKLVFPRIKYKYYYYKALYLIDKEKWLARIKLSWGLSSDKETELNFKQRIKQASRYLCMIRPAMFVCWNPNCWELGIMADVARLMGIKIGGIEWGLLPDTFILDTKGTLALSEIFNHEIAYPDNAVVETEGEKVYEQLKSESISLYKQEVKQLPEALLANNSNKTNVLLLGIDVLDSAAYPVNHPDREALLPFHNSSYEQALAFAQANPEFNVIFKPHPSHNVYTDDKQVQHNMWIFNIDPDYLINWAHVVVCTGSKMELSVLLKNKPLINVGAGLLYGKGCSYEINSPNQLAEKVIEARSAGVTPQQLREFKKVLGYLKYYYLYSYDENSDNQHTLNRFILGV